LSDRCLIIESPPVVVRIASFSLDAVRGFILYALEAVEKACFKERAARAMQRIENRERASGCQHVLGDVRAQSGRGGIALHNTIASSSGVGGGPARRHLSQPYLCALRVCGPQESHPAGGERRITIGEKLERGVAQVLSVPISTVGVRCPRTCCCGAMGSLSIVADARLVDLTMGSPRGHHAAPRTCLGRGFGV